MANYSKLSKAFTNGQLLKAVEGMNRRTSSMATVRTETTRGPTYSMTRAIGATPWQKGFICRAIVCVATTAHSQWKSLVTWTDLSERIFVFGSTFDLVSQNFINYTCVVKVRHTPNARAYVAVLCIMPNPTPTTPTNFRIA